MPRGPEAGSTAEWGICARSFGAEQVMTVRSDPDTSAIVAIYPDQATRDSAAEKIAALRGEGAKGLNTTMTGEMKGEVIASA